MISIGGDRSIDVSGLATEPYPETGGWPPVSLVERRRESDGVTRITDSIPGKVTSLDIERRERAFGDLIGRRVVCDEKWREGGYTVLSFQVVDRQ